MSDPNSLRQGRPQYPFTSWAQYDAYQRSHAPTPTPTSTPRPTPFDSSAAERRYASGAASRGTTSPTPSPTARPTRAGTVDLSDTGYTRPDIRRGAGGVSTSRTSRSPGLVAPDPNSAKYYADEFGYSSNEFNAALYNEDYAAYLEASGQDPYGDNARAGPTQLDYLNTLIDGISTDIEARRLRTDQALGEFNKRLDATRQAAQAFEGIQRYTIPTGAGYIPGYEPGGLATQVGLEARPSTPIDYDPFSIAQGIVANSPDLTSIGSGGIDAASIARQFLGG